MHERSENIGLIGDHQTDPWRVPARLPPGRLPAPALARAGSLYDKNTPAVVSARMMPLLAALQARRAPGGAT